MMSVYERVGWLLLGCAIGFVMGYIVRSLQDIKEEIHGMEETIKQERPNNRNDDGFTRWEIVSDITLLVVLILTVWAAFSSQIALNKSGDALDKTKRLAVCNQHALTQTIKALNERTDSVRAQSDAGIDVQKAQADYFRIILKQPPKSELLQRQAAEKYLDLLTDYVNKGFKARFDEAVNPLPDNKEFSDCLDPTNFPTKKENP